MPGNYILDEHGEPKAADLMEWAAWFEAADRRVAFDRLFDGTDDPVEVSTVFLGVDHRFGDGKGEPILWETMIFGGPHDGFTGRYSSRADAVDGHARAVEMARRREGDRKATRDA